MKKPWVVGLASIIPGLGYIILGKTRQGLILFLLIGASVFFAWLSPWENLTITIATLVLIAWITQGYYAVVYAQRQVKAEAGLELPVRQIPTTPPPQGASLGEKHLHKVRQTVLPLLQPEEGLKVAIEGRTGTTSLLWTLLGAPSMNIRVVYLGIAEQNLIYIKTDRLGKAEELQRIPFSQVTKASSKEGQLSDWVELQIGGNSLLRVEVPRSSREATRQLIGTLHQ